MDELLARLSDDPRRPARRWLAVGAAALVVGAGALIVRDLSRDAPAATPSHACATARPRSPGSGTHRAGPGRHRGRRRRAAERHYQTNAANYKLGDQVKMRVIVLNRPQIADVEEVRKLATQIKTKIDGGAPFVEMASTYSESPDRRQGGLWGWKQESQLRRGLWEVAYSSATGVCSRVIGMTSVSDGSYWVSHYGPSGELVVARRFNERE